MKRRIVFDIQLMRPACVLLQAVMGGDPGVANRFPVQSWLLGPTPDMRCYLATDDELAILVERVERATKEEPELPYIQHAMRRKP